MDLNDFNRIKILENKWLEHGTIMVSSDIAQFMRENYTAQAQDRALLKRMGISDGRDEQIGNEPKGTSGVG
jgi:hypothetical protein